MVTKACDDGNEIIPGIFEPTNFNRYLTVRFDNGKRAQDLDFLEIGKEIMQACVKEPKIMFQGDGTLLIETLSPEDSLAVQNLTSLNGNSSQCSPHQRMNQCRGVIRSTLLMRYSEERLKSE